MSEPIVVVSARGNTYKVLNGTYYSLDAPDNLVQILEVAREAGKGARLRVHYGSVLDKRYWNEVFTCYISRSPGEVAIPLAVNCDPNSARGALFDNCIMKIELKVGFKYRLVYKVH
jgi:hypothetical protein